MSWNDERTPVAFREAIQPKKACQVELQAAVSAEWTVKPEVPGYAGNKTKAVKVTVGITDPEVTTEHEGATPQRTFEQSFNIEQHPYLNKKTGEVAMMGKKILYSLEEALGFDPVFVDADGNAVEPVISKRTGNKMAPNKPGVHRVLHPAFSGAYFDANGNPTLEWAGKSLYADIKLEESEDGRYPAKNSIERFVKAPVTV